MILLSFHHVSDTLVNLFYVLVIGVVLVIRMSCLIFVLLSSIVLQKQKKQDRVSSYIVFNVLVTRQIK